MELLRQLERLQDAFWQPARQVRVGKIRLGQMPSVRLLEVQSPKLPQAQPIVEGQPERSSASVTVFEELEERGKRRYRRSGKPRVPHTWRTRKDPFEGVWAEVKQKLEAEPERTAKSLFLELQQEDPGRFAAGQLRTLQRRVKQWRRETLITFQTEWLAPELEPLTACSDSSRLGSAARNGLHPCPPCDWDRNICVYLPVARQSRRGPYPGHLPNRGKSCADRGTLQPLKGPAQSVIRRRAVTPFGLRPHSVTALLTLPQSGGTELHEDIPLNPVR